MNHIQDDDSPNIGLKLTFDKVNPELYTLLYLVSLLIIMAIIFLILHILNFIVIKVLWLYNYFYQNREEQNNHFDVLFD